MGSPTELEDVWITVETTKKDFTQKAHIDYLFPLEAWDFKPSKKKQAVAPVPAGEK